MIINYKEKAIKYMLHRILHYYNQNSIIRFETNPFRSDKLQEYLRNKGFVYKNDWYILGFIYVRILNDCIEIKTEGATKSIYISIDEDIISGYLDYLNKIK